MVLLTIILMDLLVGIEFDIFVPSFPSLQADFHLSPFLVEALLSVNFVGFCLSLFFMGGLADRYGRRPIIVLGLLIFILGSLLCLWPMSYEFLLIGRFLQGIGIAPPSILSFLIIADSYSLKKQQFWLAILNGLMNASVAIAPVIGSYLTLYFHWQGNFAALLILGFLVLIMTFVFIPKTKPSHVKEANPILNYIHLFQSKPLMLMIAHIVCMFVPYWIFVGMSPLLFMKNLGVKLSQFGYYQGILALIFAIGSLVFGLVVNQFSHRKMLYFSNLIFILSLITVSWVSLANNASALVITLAFIPFVFGQVIPSTILYPLCLNFMPEAKGRISAVIQGARLVFSAFFLQIASYYYQGSFRNIGFIIVGFIILTILSLVLVINAPEFGLNKKINFK